MTVPKEVSELIERFDRNIEAYRSGHYKETQLRREFIDPFFIALGWDVNNEQGYAEAYKDVIHEDAIKVGGATKAPDYCFRIGGTRKFFLEAKNPSVNIRDDINQAYQLRRYAWSAKLPLSILTDFEEFAVYDCRIKPIKTDKASTARIFYFKYNEYPDRWDEIASIFSHDAVLKGSFDKYAESSKVKRGTAEVDDAFLKEIESWRDMLARNIALRNPKLTQRELNFSVQRIIDRNIFLRICEDRGIEGYGRLMALLNGTQVYGRLCKLFREADDRYNSGLFHFRREKWRAEPPDDLTLSLKIDDKPLKDIIRSLYYPDSPYEFSVLSADILGQVYEQFLGKVIRLTSGHRAVVEDKPEVKKAGGVYYTPTYVVDYIVKNTVGKLLEGKKPGPRGGVSKLKILDPACGSGSFLIGAYQYLLDWHRDQYVADGPKKHRKELYQGPGGDWKLTTTERKRILLNNIYGVDIDPQAVEVTKLSLLLKVLEGESEETLATQLRLFHERALPDLGHNIKCGNSLIGPDFYKDKNLSIFGNEEMKKINAFDWNDKEKGFGEIMSKGGFDIVIGNPPYIRIQTLNEFSPSQVEYFNRRYSEFVLGSYDIYILFLQKGFLLLREGGIEGYILPHKFFQAEMGQKIRQYIAANKALAKVVDFTTNQIFENATTYTCLFFLTKTKNNTFLYKKFSLSEDYQSLSEITFSKLKSNLLTRETWNFTDSSTREILDKIEAQKYRFADIAEKIFKGSSTGNDSVYLLKPIKKKVKTTILFSKYLNKNIEIEDDLLVSFLFGESIRRYVVLRPEMFLLFPYKDEHGPYKLIPVKDLKEKFPLAFSYLLSVKTELQKRKIPMSSDDFYKYSAPRSLNEYRKPKIMIPDMLVSIRVSYDHDGKFFHGPAIHSIVFNEIFKQLKHSIFLGILNSKLFWFFISNTSTALRGNAYRLTPEFLAPFGFPDLNKGAFKSALETLSKLVDQTMFTHAKLNSACSELEKKHYQHKIDIIDKQIDDLVYKLYGITEEERKIIEGTG